MKQLLIFSDVKFKLCLGLLFLDDDDDNDDAYLVHSVEGGFVDMSQAFKNWKESVDCLYFDLLPSHVFIYLLHIKHTHNNF